MSHFDVIRSMSNSGVYNYVVPGLTSQLVGGVGKGMVRIFTMDRHQVMTITPHSHRFNFACLVLKGQVVNTLWVRDFRLGDPFKKSVMSYHGVIGTYSKSSAEGGDSVVKYKPHQTTYHEGEWYSMTHDEIHSITFSKDAMVLFFEGPEVIDKTIVLEPVTASGKVAETLVVTDWMFETEE